MAKLETKLQVEHRPPTQYDVEWSEVREATATEAVEAWSWALGRVGFPAVYGVAKLRLLELVSRRIDRERATAEGLARKQQAAERARREEATAREARANREANAYGGCSIPRELLVEAVHGNSGKYLPTRKAVAEELIRVVDWVVDHQLGPIGLVDDDG